MLKKIILFTSLFTLQYSASLGQSMAETLQYINTRLRNDCSAYHSGGGVSEVWSVTTDGRLVISMKDNRGPKFNTVSVYYLKSLCDNPSCLAIESNDLMASYNNGRSMHYLRFNYIPHKDLVVTVCEEMYVNRVKNAVFHLIELAKANRNYKKQDPFDY